MNKKKLLRSTIIGFVLLLLALLVTGLFGISEGMNGGVGFLNADPYTYGLKATIGYFFQPWTVAHATGYIECVLVFMAALAVIALIVMSIVKKKPVYIIPALFFGAAVAYLPFILLLVVPMVEMGVISMAAVLMMAVVTGLTLFAIYFFGIAVGDLIKEMLGALKKAAGSDAKEARSGEGLNEREVRAIVEKYLAELYDENEEEDEEEGVDEKQVRAIVDECLKEHVEELHNGEPVVAAVVAEEEPEPEEEPEEEEEEAEEEGEEEVAADDNSPAGIAAKGKRRRASFETRLKNSEFDIRHKYYDLRDYIKWYGLRNRISIPGDTFSYKRQRYIFVTIVGKHLRVYLNLDPKDYADSTIPVELAEAKKYEDLPCLLRVKSDLAYRRAKKLVDDVMAKIGIAKPEGDEPKETQGK